MLRTGSLSRSHKLLQPEREHAGGTKGTKSGSDLYEVWENNLLLVGTLMGCCKGEGEREKDRFKCL